MTDSIKEAASEYCDHLGAAGCDNNQLISIATAAFLAGAQTNLKSRGLRWRVWPEEKPEIGEWVFVWRAEELQFNWFHSSKLYDESSPEFPLWKNDNSHLCKPGDRWLPLKALECLP